MKLLRSIVPIVVISVLAACGGDNIIDTSCDEPQRYQSVSAGKRLVIPEGLDSLNEFAEMPIPAAEGAPERPKGSRCLEMAPSIRTNSN